MTQRPRLVARSTPRGARQRYRIGAAAEEGAISDSEANSGVGFARALAALMTLPHQPQTDLGNEAAALTERRLRQVQKAALVTLATLAEHKDTYATQHNLRVSRLSIQLARILQQDGHFQGTIDHRFREDLCIASMLHDVGKVTVPDQILLKPGRLNPDERAQIEKHSENGALILRRAAHLAGGGSFLSMGAEIAAAHHEKIDGSGYPRGLTGPQIPLSARITAVADVFDALTHKRVYKEAWPEDEALSYLHQRAGCDFDPLVVAALATVLEQRTQVRVIAWQPEMSVGHPELDSDHQALLELVNHLADADSRSDTLAVEGVLDELADYTFMHFEREERVLAEIGYPDLMRHQHSHRKFVDSVKAIRQRAQLAGHDQLGAQVYHLIARWLTRHILREDAVYRRFLCPTAPRRGG